MSGKGVVDSWVFSAGVDGLWDWIGASSIDVPMSCKCGFLWCLLFYVAGRLCILTSLGTEKGFINFR